MNPNDELGLPERKQYPAYVHFAFVSGILLPLAVVPYLLARRQTSHLRRRLQETENVVKTLRRELKVNALTMDMMKAEHIKSGSRTSQLQKSLADLEKRSDERQSEGIQGQKALLEYVVELEKDIGTFKSLQANTIQDVGQSLGHIAGFMHEMELSLGLEGKGEDPRGIERLRRLAARLQQR